MVFYRKYRPQIIDELDSTSVRETLYAVLQKDIPHAFLFTGPKGLGKTSTARIVAKVVNCTTDKKKRKKELEPCDNCEQCKSIKNGNNVDILEIDAASNRGIDEIRELKEKIRLAPVAAKRKVYIIDEVHMLTTEAFNALLKTLEEPPEHAMFILCTTEAHKVPDTIVSRCFQIQFKPATEEELVRSFKRIVAGEKLEIDDEALAVIAGMSDGGFRDGVKILEELSLFANGEKITKDSVEKSYKSTTILLQVAKLLVALNEYKVKEGIEVIKELLDEGVDLKFFITQVLADLHKKLLLKIGIETQKKEFSVNLRFELDEIKQLTELFTEVYSEMKYAVLPQLPLELAVIEWCSTKQNAWNQDEQNAASNAAGAEPRNQNVQYNSVSGSTSVSDLRKQVGTIKKLKAMYGTTSSPAKQNDSGEITVTTSVELLHTNGNGPVTKEWMELFWRSLIDEMKKYNHTVAGVLRGCTIKSYEDQQLVIQTAYKFHKERLDDMKNHESLMKISKLLTGKDVMITVELKQSP